MARGVNPRYPAAMQTFRRFRVHTLDDARRVLAAADAPVILDSPAGAAGWQGVGWWLALVAALRAEFPAVPFEAVLDCGDAPGLALAALRAGARAVRLEADATVLAKVAAIAGQMGARVESGERDVRPY